MENIKKFEVFLDRMIGLLDNAKKQGHIIVRVEDLENTFPELKESEDEKMVKELKRAIAVALDYSYFDKETADDCLVWLEKQGEQKTADKVEPKFKVGDWISGYYTNYKVTAINSKGYVVEDTDGNKINILFENEKFHHLFTIADAKNGDVLVVPHIEGSEHSEQIFIFKEIKDREYAKNAVEYYCRYLDGEFRTNERGFMGQADDYFTPATTEQRALLFQKMKEAGYEWDSEKKELKIIDWSKHIKYEPNSPSIIEENTEWSEEDEKMLVNCFNVLHRSDYSKNIIKEIDNWLNSLKQRIKGE